MNSSMEKEQLRAWILSVKAEGVDLAAWVRESFGAKKRPNFLYNFLDKWDKGQSPGLKYDNVQALIRGLESLKKRKENIVLLEGKSNISPFRGVIKEDAAHISDLVPVYGTASASSPGIIRFNEEYMVDKALRHPGIQNVKDSFAMYVDGHSMSPRRDHGELIYIHPYKDVHPGQDCVVVMEPDGNAIYKRYMGQTKSGDSIILKQFNPEEEFNIHLKKVRKIYAVIF